MTETAAHATPGPLLKLETAPVVLVAAAIKELGVKAAVAVGSITVNVMMVPNNLMQLGLPAVVTLTNTTVVVNVYVPTKVAVPAPSNTIV